MGRNGHSYIAAQLVDRLRVGPFNQGHEVEERRAVRFGVEHVPEAGEHLVIGDGVFFVREPRHVGLQYGSRDGIGFSICAER